MKIRGTPDRILARISDNHPGVSVALQEARQRVGTLKTKREIAPYQAACLYALLDEMVHKGYPGGVNNILEIGTALGYSAAIMAQAAPGAKIITLNPRPDECEIARNNLSVFSGVTVETVCSWDKLEEYNKDSGNPTFDVIFVDGDHAKISRDLPWFNWVSNGGLMIFHDYAPAETYRACPPVYTALNYMAAQLERPFDVEIIDNGGVGLVGFYRRDWERWPIT